MWSSLVVLVTLVIALGHAQVPQHCFSPPEMSFKVMTYNHRLTRFNFFDGEVDARGQRVAYRGDSREGSQTELHQIIALHKEKVVYEVDVLRKMCKKFPFERFFRFGVPEHAKFVDTFDVGGPGESVEVEQWYESHLIGGKGWVGDFTRRHCYPVSTFLYKDHRNETVTTSYHDVVEGITNPDWFIPPKICLNATLHSLSEMTSDALSSFPLIMN